jgi:hypothetical protein
VRSSLRKVSVDHSLAVRTPKRSMLTIALRFASYLNIQEVSVDRSLAIRKTFEHSALKKKFNILIEALCASHSQAIRTLVN